MFDFRLTEQCGASGDTPDQSVREANVRRKRNARILFGRALQHLQGRDEIRRDRLILSTDISWSPNFGDVSILSRKNILLNCAEALRELQVEYIDVLLAGADDTRIPIEDIVMSFAHLLRRGDILHWGVVGWTSARVAALVQSAQDHDVVPPSVYATVYPSYGISSSETETLYKLLNAKRIGVMVTVEFGCMKNPAEIEKLHVMARHFKMSTSALVQSWLIDSYSKPTMKRSGEPPGFVFLSTDAGLVNRSSVATYVSNIKTTIARHYEADGGIDFFGLLAFPSGCFRLLCANTIVIANTWGNATTETKDMWKKLSCNKRLSRSHHGLHCDMLPSSLQRHFRSTINAGTTKTSQESEICEGR